MTVEEFFTLFKDELNTNENLKGYYRFLNNTELYEFRKAYFCQRLEYVANNIGNNKSVKIFDIGCGYGTTAIFLALNGFTVEGNTLEYYYKQINTRLQYWSKYGDMSKVNLKYENLFDSNLKNNYYNYVITIDVLHHLEPINDALKIIYSSLLPNGKLIACEENGKNIINSTRLFLKRGNKRIIEFYDENLGKKVKMGNENIRNLKNWTNKLNEAELKINKDSIQYIRFYFPSKYKKQSASEIINKEQQLWKTNKFYKNYFFHGLNFVAVK